MFGNVYYHAIIRKIIVGFGRLFSDLKIPRYDDSGNIIQMVDVPISWSPKDKWVVRQESDPSLNNQTYIVLPRLGFEITGYEYDPNRALGKMQTIYCVNSDGTQRKQVYTPAPYNIDISLYAVTKTVEDGLAILEQILPYFKPEYTLKIKVVNDMNIVLDTPVVLNGVTVDDQYEGDMETRRFITHTFQFTLKANLIGPMSDVSLIQTATANVQDYGVYTATAETPASEVQESWNLLGD